MKKIKIVIISHNFARAMLCKRWELLARDNKNMDITLLSPETWIDGNLEAYSFGFKSTVRGEQYGHNNFHVYPIDMNQHHYISWTSKKMIQVIKKIDPHIILHIGTHLQESLMECILIKKWVCREAKIIAFSMRGPQECIKMPEKRHGFSWMKSSGFYLYRKIKLALARKGCDALLCHYPDAVQLFRKERFRCPIYVHTQVGVDTSYFAKNVEYRRRIRDKYNLGDSYVFGSAIRFTPDKGVMDILKALPDKGNWKYLLMGSGTEAEIKQIKEILQERNIEDKVIMTGYIEQDCMNQYFNAIDCAVHVPRTTKHWVETFSLAVVQAMATGKPVIGNTSGSVPYQIGKEGFIVEEGNGKDLAGKLEYVLLNQSEAGRVGEKMKYRAETCFSITHLTHHIEAIFMDVLKGVFDKNKEDMASFQSDIRGEGLRSE